MRVYLEKETKVIPIIGGSNCERVEITWEIKVLDDGYMVVEMIDFEPIPRTEVQ